MGWFSWIFGGFSGLIRLISSVVQRILDKQIVDQAKQDGKKELEGQIAKQEVEVGRKQSDILMEERTQDEIIKKLEDGKF